jgi:N-acetylmuramoyl-L-alanine amidase CwlA
MYPWKGIVDKSFTLLQFDQYCNGLQWAAWRPSFIVLHNTGNPSLAQRPNGFTSQHMKNFVSYYRDTMGWNAGPHLFIDDKQIWAFTPLTESGVHSPSWNKLALGVEMLGNYDKDAFDTGRGLKVQRNAVAAMATLCSVLGLDPQTIKLHREDLRTNHACPGKNVKKLKVIQQVQDLIVNRHGKEHRL